MVKLDDEKNVIVNKKNEIRDLLNNNYSNSTRSGSSFKAKVAHSSLNYNFFLNYFILYMYSLFNVL